jgi:hypothetical protein
VKAHAPSKPDSVKPVGIWLRVSTEDQARGESPERHEKRGTVLFPADRGRIKRARTYPAHVPFGKVRLTASSSFSCRTFTHGA